jgi:lysophospholipid acyltransferase (LPLAT)-like uncharacterized protein
VGSVGRLDGLAVARGLRWVIGLVVGVVARLWLATLRVEVVEDAGLRAVADRPWVLAFFHGTQWPLLAWQRRRPTLVMVSWSLDGVLQACALTTLGLSVVRGSSSRGGMRGLAQLTRRLRKGREDAAFAVDGPRGPYGVAKGGAALAARVAGGVVVPMGSAFAHGLVLERAWDRFGIAWPFTRVVVALGAPIEPGTGVVGDGAVVAGAITDANEVARRTLGVDLAAPGLVCAPVPGAGVAGPTK